MKDIKLIDGDFAFENGDIATVDGPDELAQTVYIGLQTNEGEWLLDPSIGLDHSVLVGKRPNEEAIRAEIMRGIFQDDRIETVDEINIDLDTKRRKLSVTFRATANDDTTIEQGVEINA